MTPALFTKQSSFPNFSTVLFTISSTSSFLATLHFTYMTFSLSSYASQSAISAITTFAWFFNNVSTIWDPIPILPPVTITTLSLMSIHSLLISYLLWLALFFLIWMFCIDVLTSWHNNNTTLCKNQSIKTHKKPYWFSSFLTKMWFFLHFTIFFAQNFSFAPQYKCTDKFCYIMIRYRYGN